MILFHLICTFLFAVGRLGGLTDGFYQALAHVYTGWLLAAGYVGRDTRCAYCEDLCGIGKCCSKGILYCHCRSCSFGKFQMFIRLYFWTLLSVECMCFIGKHWETIEMVVLQFISLLFLLFQA